MPDVTAIVVSYNARQHLRRCLAELGPGHELIVVDNASTDSSVELVEEEFPHAAILRLERNVGFGAASNVGIRHATRRYFLLLNPDAWPVADAVEELVALAERRPRAGAVGPRLVRPSGELERSVRGFPTVWRLATEYFFLRWFAPRSRALNAFYSGGFDHDAEREAEFLVGAALLLRREAVEEVGGFDPAFFMFNEEVDLCFRLRRAGWEVVFHPGATFVHVGGGSSRVDRSLLYVEQLRSHVRFLAKHHGLRAAGRGRTVLLWAMRLRSLVFRGERARISRAAADWLAANDVAAMLAAPREGADGSGAA